MFRLSKLLVVWVLRSRRLRHGGLERTQARITGFFCQYSNTSFEKTGPALPSMSLRVCYYAHRDGHQEKAPALTSDNREPDYQYPK
jgi:hypothetical protein